MTNIVNLERDMFWSSDGVDTLPVSNGWGTSPFPVGAPAAVGERVSRMQTSFFNGASGSSINAAGCLILPPPDGDSVPYRVLGGNVSTLPTVWAFGYFASGSVLGRRIFGAGLSIDRVVVVDPLDSSDPNYGKPLCFFGGSVGIGSNLFSMSVQRLISKPPQFASAVS